LRPRSNRTSSSIVRYEKGKARRVKGRPVS
jgi:hypothetical protein